MFVTVLTVFLMAASVILLVLTLVPFIRYPHGLIRGPEFIRLQLMLSALVLLAMQAVLARPDLEQPTVLAVDLMLMATVLINAVFVAKFTPLWPKQSATANATLRDQTDRHITVLTANIKMSNRDYDATLNLVRDENADIVALIEPDGAWLEAMAPLRARYRQHVEHPLETGYGLAVYSNLLLSDTQIYEPITQGVPCMRTTVTLPSGDDIRLYIVHPEPPTATDHTTGRDSDIAHAGLDAAKSRLPAIIAGDLNDVAWSHTTRRFQRITGLLDPRVGRGFFNTFNAFYPVFRWPLDHLFHDPRFRYVAMRRLPAVGSDHFPITFTLALARTEKGETPPSTEQERGAVDDMIATEKRNSRAPIGTDWEADL